MQKHLSKILVIRNDKLGDFMLAWPTFQFIKQAFPNATVYALVPEYTRPMAEICPWIDEIIIDDAVKGISGLVHTISKLKTANIDSALNLHSTPRVALALFLAGIKHRFAPASRIDQVMYNHTLTQRRSRSAKPEYEYNLDLARSVTSYYGIDHSYTMRPPLLKFADEKIQALKQDFYSSNNIELDKSLIFVHAGTGGSAINLSLEQYAELITRLSKNDKLFFVLSAGPGEEDTARQLSEQVKGCNHVIYNSRNGIIEFSKTISIASVFISGSTGTLHIAGALDLQTVAFYPKRKSATSLRWRTLNSPSRHLAFSATNTTDQEHYLIDLESTCRSILDMYF